MSNMLVNTRDQQFVLFEQLGVETLFAAKPYTDYSRDVVNMILKEAEKLAVEEILPTYVVADREGCTFTDGKVSVPASFHSAFKKYREGGWIAAPEDSDVGGQNLPMAVWTACSEFFFGASFAFSVYQCLNHGAACLVHLFGTKEQKDRYLYRMFDGEFAGTMCLTEPGAGSEVGATRTTAKLLPDGRYAIKGIKSFISGGDHDLTKQIVHLVLARIEGDIPGTAGISVFIVPKYKMNADGLVGESNDVVTGNVEHKMGIRGSATCTLNFGENDGCVGELLGSLREGMKIMFHMMNESRLEVGMQSLSGASVAYEHAVQYARERIQGKALKDMKNPDAPSVPIIEHPDIRRTLLWMKAHLEGMRGLNYFVGLCIDRAKIAQTEEERLTWNGYVELLTPACKAYCSDKAMEICSLAIDIYGGYGYIQEYPVEQYLRDMKIATIYEGTNYIQSMDLVGRKLAQRKGQNLANLLAMIRTCIDKAKENDALKDWAQYLEEALTSVEGLTRQLAVWGKSPDFVLPVLNARPYLMIFGDLVIGWQLTEGALVAVEKCATLFDRAGAKTKEAQKATAGNDREVAFYQGRIASAKYFAMNVLPTVQGRCTTIALGDKSPIEIETSFFTD